MSPPSGFNTLSVVDTASMTVETGIAVGAFPVGVALAPDGATAYVSNFDSGTLSVVDTVRAMATAAYQSGQGLRPSALSPDGTRGLRANSLSTRCRLRHAYGGGHRHCSGW